MAELVDALDLGSSAARRGGSTPSIRTKKTLDHDSMFIELEGFFTLLQNHLKYIALNITLDNSNSTDAVLKVSLTAEDYKPGVEKKTKEYGRKASIKGFRQGKVPAGIIQKMYGPSILLDEINSLVGQNLQKYIADNKLNIIGEPLPLQKEDEELDLKIGNNFEFDYEIGLIPEFTLDFDKSVDQMNVVPSDEDIDKTVENITEQAAENQEVEIAEQDDILSGLLKIETEEEPLKVVIDTKNVESDKAKAFFVGLKKDGKKTFDLRVAFPTDKEVATLLNKSEEEVAEINGKGQLRVEEISRKVPAELNQELFDKVFGAEEGIADLDAFKAKIKEQLSENFNEQAKSLANKDIQDVFAKESAIEVPLAFFKKWVLINDKNLTEEKLEQNFDKYLEDLKWMLISDKLATENEIKVEGEEVRKEAEKTIENQFMMYGMGAEQLGDKFNEFVDQYLKEENGKNYLNLYHNLRSHKVVEVIREKISIKEKAVDIEKFKKSLEN